MNVLGLDTATATSAAAVIRADGTVFEAPPADPGARGARPGHARELLPAAADVLGRAGLEPSDLDAIAVGVGPGGFTGVRVGIATARGLSLATGVALRPVSSLAAVAAGIDSPVRLALIDGGRGEVFAGCFDAAGRALEAPFAAAPEEVCVRMRAHGSKLEAAGSGSVRFFDRLEAGGIRVAPAGSPAHTTSGVSVCRLAAGADPVAAEQVRPDYLRAPDAKPR